MTVTDGMYLIKNHYFLHPLVPNREESTAQKESKAQIEPFNGPHEIKAEALWRVGVLKDDSRDDYLYITSVYHGALHHLSLLSMEGKLGVKKYKKEDPVPTWRISRLNKEEDNKEKTGYYALESADEPSATKRITGKMRDVFLEDSCKGSLAQEWDIQFMQENYFAFRNRRFGQYLSAGKEISKDSAPVTLEDTGIPRKFIWEVSLTEGRYSLRNLEVDHYLQIQLEPKLLVSVQGDASDKLSQWTFNRDVKQTVSIVNYGLSSEISRKVLLEVDCENAENREKEERKEREVRPYSITWSVKDSLSNLTEQALWRLEFIGPYKSFVTPYKAPGSEIALINSYRENIHANNVKPVQPLVRITTKFGPVEENYYTDFIFKVEETERKHSPCDELPIMGSYLILKRSLFSLKNENESRSREITALANRLSEFQHSLSDALENKITKFQQQKKGAEDEIPNMVAELVPAELAVHFGEKIKDRFQQKIQDKIKKTLNPICEEVNSLKEKAGLNDGTN